ncbi:hypothetical protein NDU88_007056 [Pleurodeles waltl]|uniref:Uncharacterized protein n=1 Tax=Pleurodeles waltl TaxID=8319 RepID=A0AAV7PMV2_PLEWA|nr:hypothetical protein NDU88_007056 [Pleurodeles waltl]
MQSGPHGPSPLSRSSPLPSVPVSLTTGRSLAVTRGQCFQGSPVSRLVVLGKSRAGSAQCPSSPARPSFSALCGALTSGPRQVQAGAGRPAASTSPCFRTPILSPGALRCDPAFGGYLRCPDLPLLSLGSAM